MKTLLTLDKTPYTADSGQLTHYREDGYLHVRGLFFEQECNTILEILLAHADEDRSPVLNLDREVSEVRSVMRAPKIVSILEVLQGREVVGLQSQIIFKEAGNPSSSQAWNVHQDNAYFCSPDGATLNCHIALDHHEVENGCLFGYAGSHREGVFPFEPTTSHNTKSGANSGNKVADEVIAKYAEAKVDFELEKGDVVFMHCNMLHGSYPNVSKERARPILTLCYISKGEYFEPGKTAKRKEIPLH
jgi:ectoine hydroxylase-related dioxygenase (phytanoyl-CoA dioxygenase family)